MDAKKLDELQTQVQAKTELGNDPSLPTPEKVARKRGRPPKSEKSDSNLKQDAGPGKTDRPDKSLTQEERVGQVRMLLTPLAQGMSGLAVNWTKTSKAAMNEKQQEAFCQSWAMVIDQYSPGLLDKHGALIIASVTTMQWGLQVYALKKLVQLGEVKPDQMPETLASVQTPHQPKGNENTESHIGPVGVMAN